MFWNEQRPQRGLDYGRKEHGHEHRVVFQSHVRATQPRTMAARTAARTLARGLIVRGKSSNATHVVGEAVTGASEAAAPTSAIQAAREAVSSYAKKHPVIFGSIITVVKTSVADIMAQKVSRT